MSNDEIVKEVAQKIAASYAFNERLTARGRPISEILAEEIVVFVQRALGK